MARTPLPVLAGEQLHQVPLTPRPSPPVLVPRVPGFLDRASEGGNEPDAAWGLLLRREGR